MKTATPPRAQEGETAGIAGAEYKNTIQSLLDFRPTSEATLAPFFGAQQTFGEDTAQTRDPGFSFQVQNKEPTAQKETPKKKAKKVRIQIPEEDPEKHTASLPGQVTPPYSPVNYIPAQSLMPAQLAP